MTNTEKDLMTNGVIEHRKDGTLSINKIIDEYERLDRNEHKDDIIFARREAHRLTLKQIGKIKMFIFELIYLYISGSESPICDHITKPV